MSLTLDKIRLSGFGGLKNYIEDHFGKDEPASACWNGARYLFHIYNVGSDIDDQNAYPHDLIDLKEMYKWEGIYHCVQENVCEFHHFTLEIKKDKLILIQTYGGIEELIIITFDKQQWIDSYIQSCKGNVDAYQSVFKIHKLPNYFNTLLTSLKYFKMPEPLSQAS